MLLASVIVPVTGMYESRAADMESDVSDNIAKLIDRFYCSEADEFIISVNDILPGRTSCIEFRGHMIILTTARGTYRSGMNIAVISDLAFGYGDIVKFTRSDDSIVAERLS
jgi:hypothetical protein